MSDSSSPHFSAHDRDGVIVARIHDREIRNPEHATTIGRDLATLIEGAGSVRLLLNLGRTQYMSSTGFATLLNLARKVSAAGGQVKVCEMTPDIRRGANIIRLGEVVEIHEDETSALDSFTS